MGEVSSQQLDEICRAIIKRFRYYTRLEDLELGAKWNLLYALRKLQGQDPDRHIRFSVAYEIDHELAGITGFDAKQFVEDELFAKLRDTSPSVEKTLAVACEIRDDPDLSSLDKNIGINTGYSFAKDCGFEGSLEDWRLAVMNDSRGEP